MTGPAMALALTLACACLRSAHAQDLVPPRLSHGCAQEPCYLLSAAFPPPPALGSDLPRVAWVCFYPLASPDDPEQRLCVPEPRADGARTAALVRTLGPGEAWAVESIAADGSSGPQLRFVAPQSAAPEATFEAPR